MFAAQHFLQKCPFPRPDISGGDALRTCESVLMVQISPACCDLAALLAHELEHMRKLLDVADFRVATGSEVGFGPRRTAATSRTAWAPRPDLPGAASNDKLPILRYLAGGDIDSPEAVEEG